MKIETGTLLPHSLQPVGQGVTGAQYAVVYISGVTQRCVVKQAGAQEIAAECLCSLLGGALSLPTLIPIIVTDPRDQTYWFGAREVGYPSLSTHLAIGSNLNDSQWAMIVSILSNWSQVGNVISFDELIENGDRNLGNILWNGTQFTIIDHERALNITPKEINKLAALATKYFDTNIIPKIRYSSVAAAMAQQAILSVDTALWQSIEDEFANTPNIIRTHCKNFINIAQGNVGTLANKAADATSPLFAGP